MQGALESVRKCWQKHNLLRIAKNGKETLNSRTNSTSRRNRHCVNWHLESHLTQQYGLPLAIVQAIVWLAKNHHMNEHLDVWIQFRARIVCNERSIHSMYRAVGAWCRVLKKPYTPYTATYRAVWSSEWVCICHIHHIKQSCTPYARLCGPMWFDKFSIPLSSV